MTQDKLVRGKLAMTRSPVDYSRITRKAGRGCKRLAGLDLASSCGVSFCDFVDGAEPVIIGGQWDLSINNFETNSIRYVRLLSFLDTLSPDLVLFEEVKFTGTANPPGMVNTNLQALVARAVTGAQVVQGLSAILGLWGEQHNVPCEAVPIGTLKKYGAGVGNANKEKMIAACNSRFGTELDAATYQQTGADNIADSMFLCAMAVEQYGATTTTREA